MPSFDLIVIGCGPGGSEAALRAAQLGLKTAIVEKDQVVGGTCLNVGCIPSKTLLYSSEVYERVKNEGETLGFHVDKLTLDFPQMMKRKEEVVEGLRKGLSAQIASHKITQISGLASFDNENSITVAGTSYTAKNFLIATGSTPTKLPFLPFDEKKILSSTGALALKKIPKSMIVIGAGVIGVELASVYRRLGTEVIIVELLDHICPGLDTDIQREFLRILKRQGLLFHLSTKIVGGRATGSGIEIDLEDGQKLKGDVALVAVGRRPYTEGLALEKAGLSLNEKGFLPVNSRFQTAQPTIYAIGDVIEGPMLAHRASTEGEAVSEYLAGKVAKVNEIAVPSVIYTDPEVASVGFTEEELKKKGIEILKGVSYFKGNPRGRCQGTPEGFVKILGEKKGGHLLGLHLIGSHVSEIISVGMMTLEQKGTILDLKEAPFPHPTLSEAVKEAAEAALSNQ